MVVRTLYCGFLLVLAPVVFGCGTRERVAQVPTGMPATQPHRQPLPLSINEIKAGLEGSGRGVDRPGQLTRIHLDRPGDQLRNVIIPHEGIVEPRV